MYLGKVAYNCADYFTDNVGSTYSIAANRVTSVTNLRQRAPIVVAGNAYKAPKVFRDNRTNSFTTNYATKLKELEKPTEGDSAESLTAYHRPNFQR